MKQHIRRALPESVLDVIRTARAALRTRRDARMSAQDVFSRIYETNTWGGVEGEYSSGSGSHDPEVVGPYVDAVRRRISELYPSGHLTAVDLGCGDFAVGSQVYEPGMRYVACDLVPGVIEQNRMRYPDSAIEFIVLDLIADPLPSGDVAFVRQVLQHLSNAQVSAILPKLRAYSTVFITEHYPNPKEPLIPNLDKVHGGGIRATRGSAVALTEPPFTLPAEEVRLLVEVQAQALSDREPPGVIRTFEYTPGARKP